VCFVEGGGKKKKNKKRKRKKILKKKQEKPDIVRVCVCRSYATLYQVPYSIFH